MQMTSTENLFYGTYFMTLAGFFPLFPVVFSLCFGVQKRLNLLRSGDSLVYQLVPEDTAAKFEGLG